MSQSLSNTLNQHWREILALKQRLSGVSGGSSGSGVTAAVKTRMLVWTITQSGSPWFDGDLEPLSCPVTGTITRWRLMADAVGDVTVAIYKDDFASYPPTSGDDIGMTIALSSADNAEDATPDGSTGIIAGDVFIPNISGASGITSLTLELWILVT